MTEETKLTGGTSFLVTLASLVIVLWGMSQAKTVLMLSIISIFLAILGMPLVAWLQKKGFPSSLAVLTVMASMVAVLLGLGVLVGTSIRNFSDNWPSFMSRIQGFPFLKDFLDTKHRGASTATFLRFFNPESLVTMSMGMLVGMGTALSDIVVILLIVAFILLEASTLPSKMSAVLGPNQGNYQKIMKLIDDIKRYLILQTMLNLIAGISIWLLLSILGVNYPVLWGFLTFLFHYIPNIGSIIAAVPALLQVMIQYGTVRTLIAAAGFLVVFFVVGNVVQPRLMGRSLGLSPLVIFLSLIYWGSLLGLIGMVLSIPITMMLKLILESRPSTRWIGDLLGHGPVPPSRKHDGEFDHGSTS